MDGQTLRHPFPAEGFGFEIIGQSGTYHVVGHILERRPILPPLLNALRPHFVETQDTIWQREKVQECLDPRDRLQRGKNSDEAC